MAGNVPVGGGLHAAPTRWQQVLRRVFAPLYPRGPGRVFASTPAWAYIFAVASWVLLMMRQLPCRWSAPDSNPDRFGWMCYSDITALYFSRGQATGGVPYSSVMWEYPVLTGYWAALANGIAGVFGAVFQPDISGQQMVDNMNIYFAVNSVGLFVCLLWTVHSLLRIAGNRPGLVVMVAILPAVWTTGLINWDFLAVALTMAGLADWMEKRRVRVGIFLGLAVAAKLFPVVIIGALIVVAVRRETWREPLVALRQWGTMAGTAALTWVVVNLPVMVSQFDGWATFYTFNSDRGADFGSPWYALDLAGIGVPNPIMWSRVSMIVGYLALALLIYRAPKPPSVPQIAYLAVVIMAAGNLVYSPQYVLWMLPLVVLVLPRLVPLVVFSVAELVYFVFIWLWLRGNDLTLGLSSAPWLYILATWLRLAATAWLAGVVVVDILRGRVDPLGNHGVLSRDEDMRSPRGVTVDNRRDAVAREGGATQSEPRDGDEPPDGEELAAQSGVTLSDDRVDLS